MNSEQFYKLQEIKLTITALINKATKKDKEVEKELKERPHPTGRDLSINRLVFYLDHENYKQLIFSLNQFCQIIEELDERITDQEKKTKKIKRRLDE